MDRFEEVETLYYNIVLSEKLEKQAKATITSDILTKLNISFENLPLKCQQLLEQVAEKQSSLELDQLDSITLSLRASRDQSEKLEEEYELLKLKQKNAELQAKIDRNNTFLQNLRKELDSSKKRLYNQNINPNNIQEHIRQLKQKLGSYEESCEKAKAKFSKLSVPNNILPASVLSLVATRDTLRQEAESLQHRANDVVLMRHARVAFKRLQK